VLFIWVITGFAVAAKQVGVAAADDAGPIDATLAIGMVATGLIAATCGLATAKHIARRPVCNTGRAGRRGPGEGRPTQKDIDSK